MAKQDTFGVSSRTRPELGKITVTTKRKPETLEEFAELDLVANFPSDVIDLAWQTWVVKCQTGCRDRLEEGAEAVQEYADDYTYSGGRGAGRTRARPKLAKEKVSALKFTAAQLEALKAVGIVVEE